MAMKTIWTILSVLAVANLLALAAFAGWLKVSDRVDIARVRGVRQMFMETLTQQKSREDEARAQAEADDKAAAQKAQEGQPPIGAADALSLKLGQGKADQERLESLKREVQILRETLRRERNQLDADKAAFKKEQEDFERARTVIA